MSRRESERARIGRLPLFGVPPRRMIAEVPEISDLIAERLAPPPLEVVRPEDLVHLTFSFINLHLSGGDKGEPPLLIRTFDRRPAYLVVDCHSQHITEAALFEVAPHYPVTTPPIPLHLPAGTTPNDFKDPDEGKSGFDLTNPADLARLPFPPLFASLSGASRLVFRVTSQAIPFSAPGLIAAMSTLDLSVAPHAVPPVRPRLPTWGSLYVSDAVDITGILRETNAPVVRRTRGRPHVDSHHGPTRVSADLIALGRLQATAGALEYRFGTEAAVNAAASASRGDKLGLTTVVGDLSKRIPFDILPPPPRPPGATETAIELPWRLQISPNEHGAFAHSPVAIEHNGRYELWHSRLGIRSSDEKGNPTVVELPPEPPTIRAIWARDYDILPEARLDPNLAFVERPTSVNFPGADPSEDRPPVRMALNSRDRMMLVHETSNFHLLRNHRPGWVPEAVPTNRLMISALGGWLDSRVTFDTLPDGGLTIEEWKHRVALGRDHQVKVVYAGFLLPFGHRASLVKVTERKIATGPAGPVAYLFQRMFIIVREPEKRFRDDTRALQDGRRLDLVMPLGTVRILTTITPPLDPPASLVPGPGGFLFEPHVAGTPFLFKILAVDLEQNVVEFAAPLAFMERDRNDTALAPPQQQPPPPQQKKSVLQVALDAYNTSHLVDREFDLHGQKVAYADSAQPDDTTLATRSLTFEVVTSEFLGARPQDEPRFLPVLEEAKTVVPAMSALAGAATPTRVKYPDHYAAQGFAANAVEAFLEMPDPPPMSFGGQGDRSGGFVTPSLNVKALSRLTGPISGDVQKAIDGAADFNAGKFFENISAKLFGLIPLPELLRTLGLDPAKLPTFVTQALDIATVLQQNVERVRNAANGLTGQAGQLGTAAATMKTHADTLLADLATLAANPNTDTPPNLAGDLAAIAGDVDAGNAGSFAARVAGAADDVLPRPQREQLLGMAQRIHDQLEDVAAVAAAAQALIQFAKGLQLPEVITARLDWSTELDAWPDTNDPPKKSVFLPLGNGNRGKLTVAVEVQAPTRPGKQPSALVSCSISPFDLRLIGEVTFLVLHFEVMEFSIAPGKKPDVNVKFRDPNGIAFDGPLEFVNKLKDIIPSAGFSDPPSLDVTAEGIKAGFDLAIPDLAVGVFALSNISVGAHFRVPFIDESIETAFNFSTRENPFRLQVALFAGGGFFGITITPKEVRILEAAFEFGAAVSVNLGVASGGVSIMAGIYFRMETVTGHTEAQLTGYFRMRGEVDVLGLISACIELYLSLTYETATGKAAGRATISIEVEVFFLSFSVSVTCEKKFAGSHGDPSFVAVMGLPPAAPPGTVRPWDTYCLAFADD